MRMLEMKILAYLAARISSTREDVRTNNSKSSGKERSLVGFGGRCDMLEMQDVLWL